jgi:hypothetical protein
MPKIEMVSAEFFRMLTVYWFCFVVGGVFVLLAVLGGLDGANLDMHFDIHGEAPLDSDVELNDPGDRPNQGRNGRRFLVNMLRSLKFWTFGLCFFGLTGLVLSQMALPAMGIAIAAVNMGIICGAMVSGALQVLRGRQVDSLVRTNDLVGLPGTVELPFDAMSRGKVRLLVKGTMVSAIAYTDEEKAFQPGDQILVVGTEQNRLWVVSTDTFRKSSGQREEKPLQRLEENE